MNDAIATSLEEIPDEVRSSFWHRLMDGESVSDIVRLSWRDFARARCVHHDEASPAAVRQVLASEPPDDVLADLRYRHRVRATWIGASYFSGDGDAMPLVIVFRPWRMSTASFHKALRAIRRDFAADYPSGSIDLLIVGDLDMETALSMIDTKGTAAWISAADGVVTRYEGRFASEPHSEPTVR